MDLEHEDIEEKEAKKKAKISKVRKLWMVSGCLFSSVSLIVIFFVLIGIVLFMLLGDEKKEPVSGGGRVNR